MLRPFSSGKQLFQTRADFFEEGFAVDGFYLYALVHKVDEVLCHNAFLQSLYASLFQLFAELDKLGRLSSSPRFLNAPVQAKMVAMGFVEVSSPLRYL